MRVYDFVDAIKIENVHTIILIAKHLLNELAISLRLHSRPIVLDARCRRGVTQRVIGSTSSSILDMNTMG